MFHQLDVQGLKCKECKFRCHTQCEAQVNLTSLPLPSKNLIFIANIIVIANVIIIVRGIFTVITAICTITKNTLWSTPPFQVPPSCGLPAELLEIYWEHMKVSWFSFSKYFSQLNLLQGSRGKPKPATILATSRPDQSLWVELKLLQLLHPKLTTGDCLLISHLFSAILIREYQKTPIFEIGRPI